MSKKEKHVTCMRKVEITLVSSEKDSQNLLGKICKSILAILIAHY